MALESATYIDDLNVSNPAASDAVGQADDHIRMLKAVLKNTFPYIDAPVTATPLMLNKGTVPIGLVAMWAGSPASLPDDWRLCDGGTYARSDGAGNIIVPDLRGKFIKGCGGSTGSPSASPTKGTVGGSATHTHTPTINGTAITQAQLPNYELTVSDPTHTHSAGDYGHNHSYTQDVAATGLAGFTGVTWNLSSAAATTGTGYANIWVAGNYTGVRVYSGGSGQAHSHSASISTDNGEPPYYVLAYIIKI